MFIGAINTIIFLTKYNYVRITFLVYPGQVVLIPPQHKIGNFLLCICIGKCCEEDYNKGILYAAPYSFLLSDIFNYIHPLQ